MPKKVTNAKIACLDFSLQKAKMALGVSVVVEDPDKLEAIRKRLVTLFKWMIPAIDKILIEARSTNHSWNEHLKMSKTAKNGCYML